MTTPIPETQAEAMFTEFAKSPRTDSFSSFNWFTAGIVFAEEWHKHEAAIVQPVQPASWQPINDDTPTDNKRLLYLAKFHEAGVLQQIDFDGIWEHESGTWETPENYWYWASANGIEEPTHWAYQDEPIPTVNNHQPARPPCVSQNGESEKQDRLSLTNATQTAEPLAATLSTAPACLNTNDKAMWVLGWNDRDETAHNIKERNA